ncbi:hypothetical protein CEXT_385231 [Caerostris extrusa]|uniref:Uncharacterized protein n=1 Tax=Caerostris extrusa TaxID=172846 RepID=A0AAV4UQR6_CAEEX|nr:hypothetical protein CEXT_385231 [Caerostris extrusa]
MEWKFHQRGGPRPKYSWHVQRWCGRAPLRKCSPVCSPLHLAGINPISRTHLQAHVGSRARTTRRVVGNCHRRTSQEKDKLMNQNEELRKVIKTVVSCGEGQGGRKIRFWGFKQRRLIGWRKSPGATAI